MKALKRLETLRAQLCEIECLVEAAEDKVRRNNFKRNRKQWRKKMAKDPVTRLLARMTNQMFGKLPEPGIAMMGLSKQLEGNV